MLTATNTTRVVDKIQTYISSLERATEGRRETDAPKLQIEELGMLKGLYFALNTIKAHTAPGPPNLYEFGLMLDAVIDTVEPCLSPMYERMKDYFLLRNLEQNKIIKRSKQNERKRKRTE